ncbi:hypothetical protein FA95DRAFT_90430 [Auriscalpium vulgare]|uniref:Uncharacterized protein n=1 Tax=Auriscalpium vulgare TaxID=40419 RepID=A0ACB8RP19_9AGAM|nr:hypothetical protein FA95DRAFT_90430 [Auriscalpium vulgare]
MSGFVDICLAKKSFSLEVPQPDRNLPGRRPGARRNPFTEQDDQNLAKFLAQTIPNKEDGGRTGSVIYYELMRHAAEHNVRAWALEHTADSWRERYRKHQEEFDPMIDAYAKGHPPPANGKGQYLEIRKNRHNRRRRNVGGGENLEEDGEDEEENGAKAELRREEEEEEEEEEVPPADPPQHESPARSQARAGGSQERAREEGPVNAQRPLRSGPPARKKRREIPQPQQFDSVPDVEAGLEAREVQAGPSRIRRSPAPSPSQPTEEQETAMPMTPPTTQLWPRPRRQVEVVVPARPKPSSAQKRAVRSPPPVSDDGPATRTRARSASVEPHAQSDLRSRQRKVPFKAARRRPAVDSIVEETPQPEVPDEDGNGESMEVEAYLDPANGDDGLFDEGAQDSIARLSPDDLQTAQRLSSHGQPKAPSVPPSDDEGDSGMLAKLKQTQQRAPTSRVAKSSPRIAPRRPVIRRRDTGESEEEFPSPHTRARDEKDRRVREAKGKEFQPQPGTRAAALRAATTASLRTQR